MQYRQRFNHCNTEHVSYFNLNVLSLLSLKNIQTHFKMKYSIVEIENHLTEHIVSYCLCKIKSI